MYATYMFLIYTPLYNALVYLVGLFPSGDVGIALIILTIVVKALLHPLSRNAQRTQIVMKEIQPQLNEIKKKYEKDPVAQYREMSALYKNNNIRPLGSFLLIFIQIPIILGLYQVFIHGGLPTVNASLLYSFVSVPSMVSMSFLGVIDLAGKSIVLAVIAGAFQSLQGFLLPQPALTEEKSFANDFAKSLQLQTKYVFPILIAFVSYTASAAVAVYFIVSSIFSICELMIITRSQKMSQLTKDASVLPTA
jgi:YidC/Oxa1 family membrane protein insertase